MMQHNLSFAGAGRVSFALCREMFHAGFKIELIVSQNEKNGRSLSDLYNASWSEDLTFPDSTDIIIVAVPDHKLKSILYKIKCRPETLVVHTAGSFGVDVFPEHIKRKGVFYPLQTFTKEREVDFKDLPIFIEAPDEQSLLFLTNLVESIGGKVYVIDTDHRRMIHVAAVFVCNFTNHILTEGKEVVLKAGFPFEVLRPLLLETISKALDIGPENAQTGPAIRNDQNTIEKHLELLSFSSELQRIYSEMTQSVIKHYTK